MRDADVARLRARFFTPLGADGTESIDSKGESVGVRLARRPIAVGAAHDPATRADARRAGIEAAAREHAAVATFARLSLELLALGAPSDLVVAAHDAALDEVRHARQSYAIASALGETVVGPDALAAATAPIAPPT